MTPAYARIVAPGKTAKDIKQTVEMMNNWGHLVANYEVRHGPIEDVAKITGLKQLIPESVLDHHFRGRSYEKFQNFRQELTNFLNDRPKAKEDSKMDIDALLAQLAHPADLHSDCCDHPPAPEQEEGDLETM